jgi:hypothetical protein
MQSVLQSATNARVTAAFTTLQQQHNNNTENELKPFDTRGLGYNM